MTTISLHKKISSVLATLLASAVSAVAGDSFAIWAPKMVITEDSIEKNQAFHYSKGANSQNILEAFNTAIRKYYPDIKTELDKKNVKNSFAVYLKVSRASIYEEQLPNSSVKSYTLPVTASINFINMANGDIIYSHSYTNIVQGNLAASGDEKIKKLAEWYTSGYSSLFEHLAKEASQKFKPHKLSTKVIGKYDGLLILDKGLDGGIAKGDTLDRENGSVEVLYSANGYSIGQDEFPKYPSQDGDILVKTYNGSLDGVKKPRVTLLDISTDKQIGDLPPEQMLYDVFSDKIAQQGSFTVASIGKDFYAAKRDIISKSGVRVLEGKRLVPDYYIRLSYDGPFYYSAPTNLDYAEQRHYYAGACGELVDISGRVFHSDCAFDNISDEIVHGKGLSKSSRYETAMKNATLSLAESFSKGVSFDKVSYKITNLKASKIEFEDEKNLLAPGASITIYKNIGSVGDKKDVLIPIQEATIDEKKEGTVIATLDSIKITPKLNAEKGDFIVEDIVSANTPSDAKLFSFCAKSGKMDIGTIDGYDSVTRYLVKKTFKQLLYDGQGLTEAIRKNIDEAKFEHTPKVTTPSTKYCVQPLYWLEPKGKKQSEHIGFETALFDITSGFRIYETNEIKNKTPKDAAFVSKKSFETNPALEIPIKSSKEYLRIELLKNSLPSFSSSVSSIQTP